MAYTFVVSPLRPKGDVIGSTRILAGVITADAASGSVSPGMNNIYNVHVSAKSAGTAGATVTWTNTSVSLASIASGDDFAVTIWGL